ncbi:hypothetical protein [Leifsonia sp. Leaf264]|uniref:hypothetical protein n=1 Tax=Leifsonia sp. Leaf264 TaxID=1736314 RepID=UPI0006FA0CD2|nr:hypothetical protein [Leifsonia sp. Leaf264]KQP01438.1 hypothetical protein ASF30_02130 [Leifsonia sp. Leaf264]
MDVFWATMVGAIVGAGVGAFSSWLFALDLRRREARERAENREHERLDRAAEREDARRERQIEMKQLSNQKRILTMRGGLAGVWSILWDWTLAETAVERAERQALFVQALHEAKSETRHEESDLWWELYRMARYPIFERLPQVADLLQDYLAGYGRISNPRRAAIRATSKPLRPVESIED